MPFAFEDTFAEVQANLDVYVDEVFACLESEFLVMPRGPDFVEYSIFASGYEALKRATTGFRDVTPETVAPVVFRLPIALIVLRCMLGFTPTEWAYYATQETNVEIPQRAVRALDRQVRMDPKKPLNQNGGTTEQRVHALITAACQILNEGAPTVAPDKLHRLDKADTAEGLIGMQSLADRGVPYAMLLYERFLGRPFAGHRDSVSELVGDLVENAIEEVLHRAGISFRKTGRAERIPGFDQAPDFIVPDEFNPQIIIEAKLTEDDGTARDKITRIQHLAELAVKDQPADQPKFEVVACIAGRGFKVRREDIKKLLMATRGKVFTLQNLQQLVECTGLQEFRSQ